VHEATDYIQTARIKPERQVLVTARFLEGKARNFYMQRVAKRVEEWSLQAFFAGLFNDIFHRNYRITIIDRIAEYEQGSRTVRVYANGLENLYDLLGNESPRTMVRKLWQGLRLSIRQRLCDFEYSAEINTWDEIVHKAETIEIGEQEAAREAARERRRRDKDDDNRKSSRNDKNNDRRGPSRNHGGFSGSKNNNSSSNNRGNDYNGSKPSHDDRNSKYKGKRRDDRNSSGQDQRAPKLSEEEQNRLRAEGKCFKCKEPGHVSRNCKNGHTVKGSGSGPPGQSSSNYKGKQSSSTKFSVNKLEALDRANSTLGTQVDMQLHSIDYANIVVFADDILVPMELPELSLEDLRSVMDYAQDMRTSMGIETPSSNSPEDDNLSETTDGATGMPDLETISNATWPSTSRSGGPASSDFHGSDSESDDSPDNDWCDDQHWDESDLDDDYSEVDEDESQHSDDLVLPLTEELLSEFNGESSTTNGLFVGATQPDSVLFERNASIPRDFTRVVPLPLVVAVKINGKPCRALLDSGSFGDLVSTSLVDQLGLKTVELEKPITLHLAVQGSRSKITRGTKARLSYQSLSEDRYFDVANLSNYDLILGMPFLFQHKVSLTANPASVVVNSIESVPIKGQNVASIHARAVDVVEEGLEDIRQSLKSYAREKGLFQDPGETPLPPLRAINHDIPLIDLELLMPWRPSRCPEKYRSLWALKREQYIRTGRWRVSTARNSVPMMFIPKPGRPDEVRNVLDMRPRNKNTRKVQAPLPQTEGVLRRVARKPYKSLIDLAGAYDQMRINPEHVNRTAMNTPDGTLESLVMQQGDCNAPASWQALMNHLLAPYLGVFTDAYLDDIVIYSDTLEDHIKHVKIIFDILHEQRLYVGEKKLYLLARELKLLGHIIDTDGIRMDPAKVDSVINWKTPTSKELLQGFLGSVGFLADDIEGVRIPMGLLHGLCGGTVPFRWSETHQRAFEQIKEFTHSAREKHRMPLDYSDTAPPINMVTDASSSGISGVISQGKDYKTAKVAALYSAKLNSAQQNYPVHELEMFAGVETMRRHREILLGTHFRWFTDHRSLERLLTQLNLSGRQARWMELISEFDFEVIYIKGKENALSDALSRIYSNDAPGTVRAASEFTEHDEDYPIERMISAGISMPVFVGIEANAMTLRQRGPRVESSKHFAKKMKDKPLKIRGPHRGGEETEKQAHQNTLEEVIWAGQLPESSAEADELTHGNLLVDFVAKAQPDDDVIRAIKGSYENDKFFADIVQKLKEYKNFSYVDGLLFLKTKDREVLCIPEGATVKNRNVRELLISQAHSLLAHLGPGKTLAYLRDNCWWKSMNDHVQKFCESCTTCKRTKTTTQRPYGLLNPLEVPSAPWQTIGIDFVGPFPVSKNRYGEFDTITVVVDHFTSMVHLIPSRDDYAAPDIAELVFQEVYRLHGLPEHIVSDRDVLFTSNFWTHLHELTGVGLRKSSAFHPESDGATERQNRTVGQMLRQCISPKQNDWVIKLPAIEFAINLATSSTTGFSPFFLNSGRVPRPFNWLSPSDTEFPGVRKFSERLRLAVMAAHDSILAARVKQTRDANRKRRPSPFKVGEMVYVSTKNIALKKGLARKLAPKYMGPYLIEKDFSNGSYLIRLPHELKARGIHPVYHASLLRIHVPNDDKLFPNRADSDLGIMDNLDAEWRVNAIVSHQGASRDAMFEVEWSTGDRTWLPYNDLKEFEAMKDYFNILGITDIENLRVPEGRDSSSSGIFYSGAVWGWPEQRSINGEKRRHPRRPQKDVLKGKGRDAPSIISHSFPLPRNPGGSHFRSRQPQQVKPSLRGGHTPPLSHLPPNRYSLRQRAPPPASNSLPLRTCCSTAHVDHSCSSLRKYSHPMQPVRQSKVSGMSSALDNNYVIRINPDRVATVDQGAGCSYMWTRDQIELFVKHGSYCSSDKIPDNHIEPGGLTEFALAWNQQENVSAFMAYTDPRSGNTVTFKKGPSVADICGQPKPSTKRKAAEISDDGMLVVNGVADVFKIMRSQSDYDRATEALRKSLDISFRREERWKEDGEAKKRQKAVIRDLPKFSMKDVAVRDGAKKGKAPKPAVPTPVVEKTPEAGPSRSTEPEPERMQVDERPVATEKPNKRPERKATASATPAAKKSSTSTAAKAGTQAPQA